MRLLVASLLLLAVVTDTTRAAEKSKRPAPPAITKPVPASNPRDTARERLFGERKSPAAFQAAVDEARKQGINDQAILEARFLFLVDHHQDDAIVALLPEFVKHRESFNPDDSEIFATKEDWLAVNEFIEALAALAKSNKEEFRKHITEAFWLSPQQAAAYAPYINRLRLDDAMRSIKIDFSSEFSTIISDEPESLKKFIGDKKALLLHFWSPWSNASEESMPDFIVTATQLAAHDVAVVSVLAQGPNKIITDARAALKSYGKNLPGAWLVDKKSPSLNRMLRVQSLPTMVVVSPDGSILFNGDPADDELWKTLTKINPAIHRPHAGNHPNPP